MKRNLLATLAICGLLASAPVAAGGDFQKDSQTVTQIQEKLKQQGFNPGEVDGTWGPKTAEALKEFQQKQGMQASGELDHKTAQALGIELAGADHSQHTTGSGSSSQPSLGSGSSESDKMLKDAQKDAEKPEKKN